jgi:hypothetical protein
LALYLYTDVIKCRHYILCCNNLVFYELWVLRAVPDPILCRIYYNNQEVSDGHLAGPLDAGQPASLACLAEGGRPPPAVLWYRNTVLVDSSWDDPPAAADMRNGDEQMAEAVMTSRVLNVLMLPRVGRPEAVDRFTCRASNSNHSSSYNSSNNSSGEVEATVGLRINFPPQSVTISQLPEEIHTGKAFHVRCRVLGAQPSVDITWWLDGQLLGPPATEADNGAVADENETRIAAAHNNGAAAADSSFSAYLYRKFVAEDNGRLLTCRATNPALKIAVPPAEASRRLNVLFPPRPRLVYGTNIRPEEVREGQDVYLQCQAAANPAVTRLSWALNGFPVVAGSRQNGGGGGHSNNVLVSGSSLVLQGVGREMSGNYTCTLSNPVGDAVR